ncbi:MAG: PUA domain-containing protein [Candidatus Nitrosoabyssus spongiisocia]|nr:MAG: PUA domain-containing protein [Nitrosopumilaceae archaeon AB1(1)]
MDNHLKIIHTLDALFGEGTSAQLPKNYSMDFSRTGKIKSVYENDNLLCTLRIDGGLAITPYFAQILLKSDTFKDNCLEIDDDSKIFVEEGKSVFCKHVTWCGENVMVSADTPILHQNHVIAVGRAVLPSFIIKTQTRGVAVKVRHSLKSDHMVGDSS